MIRRGKSSSYSLKKSIHIETDIKFDYIDAKNVLGVIEGSDSILKHEYVVVGGHFDHLGFGGFRSGSRKSDTIAVHNGADDNASGIASIIEIGERLAANKDQLKRSVIIIGFDGEEMGLLGSQAFLESNIVTTSSIRSMLNFDMVGRFNNATKRLSIKGTGTTSDWEELLMHVEEGKDLEFLHSSYGIGPSDHANFYRKSIPAIMITTGLHSDYHMPEDDVDKINFSGQKIISDFAYEIAYKAATEDYKFAFTPTTYKSNGGLNVDLGIIPDVKSKINGGMPIKSVIKKSYAQKAGLLAGDIIIKMNNIKIKSLKEYVHIIQKLRKGQELTINIVRGRTFKNYLIKLD